MKSEVLMSSINDRSSIDCRAERSMSVRTECINRLKTVAGSLLCIEGALLAESAFACGGFCYTILAL